MNCKNMKYDIAGMCVYVGKTDIYRPQELQAKIPFIMYQEYPVWDGQ